MAKVVDKIYNTFLVRLTFKEFQEVCKIWLIKDEDDLFDKAAKSKIVKEKLSL